MLYLACFHIDCENAVGAGTGHVHWGLADGSVGVAQEKLQASSPCFVLAHAHYNIGVRKSFARRCDTEECQAPQSGKK